MAALIRKYIIGKNRLSRGHLNGFTVSDGGAIETEPGKVIHTLFLGRLDSSEPDCPWGRLCFDAQLSEEMVFIVWVFASNQEDFVNHQQIVGYQQFLLDPNIALERKEKLFMLAGASKFVGVNDMLLYEQKGRYLWIFVKALGDGKARLENFSVYAPGDNFFHTFPEIYRNNGDFLHRYLSIFSSLYSDLQQTIDSLERYVDIQNAPSALLPVFAKWLGISLDGNFLEEDKQRLLLKNAFSWIKGKGSRRVILEIVKLFVQEPVYIIEQGVVLSHFSPKDLEVYERIYGAQKYGFTILINRPPDEKLHARLIYLINQFKPVRARVSVVFLGSCCSIDAHCYLDINARIARPMEGYLDGQNVLGGILVLQ